MRITRLEAENFKRLRAVAIKPDGSVVEIRGRNGQGKSSVLDAIEAACAGGTLPSRPIRDGAENAKIVTELDNGLVITRRFLASGNTTLTVANAEGARFQSPQSVLDKLTGAIAFDPLEFARMKPAARLETLRRLVKLDIDIDAVERERAATYVNRTQANREALTYRKQAEGIVVAPGLPDEEPDIDAILGEVKVIENRNAAIVSERAARDEQRRRAEAKKTEIVMLKARREDLRRQLEQLSTDYDRLVEEHNDECDAIDALPPIDEPADTSTLLASISQAQKVKAQIADRNRRDELAALAAEKEAESDNLTKAIEACDQSKADALARATLPVDGLGFGDGDITFNGIPFEQSSQAERIRVSAAIAMAANPSLRVLLIRDGSLLDHDSLKALAEQVRAADYQLWIERVGDDAETGVIIEDGMAAEAWGSAVEIGDPVEPTEIPVEEAAQ